MTFAEAMTLKPGQIIYHILNKDSRGLPQKWRVSGKTKTWKREPTKIRIPIKWGLRHSAYLTETNLGMFSLDENPSGD